MSLILNIDTATDKASVSLAFEGKVLQERLSDNQSNHASWIHIAIDDMLQSVHPTYNIKNIRGISLVTGPGSYTGLRVGMATAKGMCYALNIPLISLSTLKLMAHATNDYNSSSFLLCPMLDARRMEVFTALYDAKLKELIAPQALILEEDCFSVWLNKYKIIFFGSGSNKWRELVRNDNAIFSGVFYTTHNISFLAYEKYMQHTFSNLPYSEPVYLKDFYSVPTKR